MAFSPPIPAEYYWLLVFIFTIIGIFSFLWLIFFVETSRDLSKRDRFIGLTNRIILSSLSLGLALAFWGLVRLY